MRPFSGKLQHEITIQVNTPGTPDADGNVKQGNWSDLYTGVPASVKPISGREVWAGERATAQRTHTVLIRFMEGVTTDHRIKFGDRIFNIVGIVNTDEMDDSLMVSVLEQV